MDVKLPQVSGKEMSQILIRLSFQLKSQKGSHQKFVRKINNRKEMIIVPNHKLLKKGTLHGILSQLHMTPREFRDLM